MCEESNILGYDPINAVEWLDADTLSANAWNPNVVFNPELKLLERSILLTGWVQPVLVAKDLMIIDGFHRWRLSLESKALMKKYQGRLPCCILEIGQAQAMILTVRMNRAKGTHTALKMSSLVKALIDDHGMDRQQLAAEIGATSQEIDLLYQDGVFTAKKIDQYKYSKAWYPAKG